MKCNELAATSFICESPINNNSKINNIKLSLGKRKTCKRNWILFKDKCYTFFNQSLSLANQDILCPNHITSIPRFLNNTQKDVSELTGLFDIFSYHESVHTQIVLTRDKKGKCFVTLRENTLHWRQYNFQIIKQDCDQVNGLYLCQEDPFYWKTICLDFQFQCNDMTCISDISVCDGLRDCPGGEDEVECGCQAITVSPNWLGEHATL